MRTYTSEKLKKLLVIVRWRHALNQMHFVDSLRQRRLYRTCV